MSDRYSSEAGRIIAAALRTALEPHCERIEVVGSLRRNRPTVGDVELLYIPKFETRRSKIDMFAYEGVNLADLEIARLEKDGILSRRKSSAGHEAFGPKNKLMAHRASGIPVDLFATDDAGWWVSLVIRTGSKENNLRLTTGANKIGRTLNAYGAGVTVRETGDIIPARSERDVFNLCNVPYLPPEQR